MKQFILLMLIAFFFTACSSSSDDEKQEPPSLPNMSELELRLPENAPVGLTLNASFAGIGITTFSAFSQLPKGYFEDGIWTWVYLYNQLMMTVTAEGTNNGDYLWKFYLNGTDSQFGPTFDNFLIMDGLISKNGKSGTITNYLAIDGSDATMPSTWEIGDAGSFTSTTTISAFQDYGDSTFKMVQNADGSGSFILSSGSTVIYSATWDINGVVTETSITV